MRRIVATTLFLVFIAQSSGVGLADSSPGVTLVKIRTLVGQAASHFGSVMRPKANVRPHIPRADVVPAIPAGVSVPIIDNQLILPSAIAPPDTPSTGALPNSGSAVSTHKRAPLVPLATMPTPSPAIRTSVNPAATAAPAQSQTGINHWWTFEEGSIPGAGRYMVNVGTGNLIVQSDDVDVHERGIDLAFRRTFNSLSNHTYANDDGSVPSNYGQLWTNNFDGHLIADDTNTNVTIYDLDGAAYTYVCVSDGTCTSPPGMEGTTLRSTSSCTWSWTRKDYTVYQFYGTHADTSCGDLPLQDGRLREIFAPNWNNYIKFNYFHGTGNDYTQITSIQAVHSDGQMLVLTFGDVQGRRLLTQVKRPDGVTITYQYDTEGRLIEVNLPTDAQNSDREIAYSYTGNRITQVLGPRYAYSAEYNSGNATDGGGVFFSYDGSWRVTNVEDHGVVNFAPDSDESAANTYLDSNTGNRGDIAWRDTYFTYTLGQTELTDTDVHQTIWLYDSLGRVTETDAYGTGTEPYIASTPLPTLETWNSHNNLTSTTDANKHETDYAYDAYGNTIAVALPTVQTSQGYFRPTSLYSYESFTPSSGVTYTHISAYCDSYSVAASGYDWNGRPQSDNLCTTKATTYTWYHGDTMQPSGRLTDTYSPCYNASCAHLGKHEKIAYDTGDFGLPTSITEDCYNQYDSSNICPQKTFTYDTNGLGNLTSYDPGNGAWTLSYDNENRLISATDPDGVTTRTCYFNDDFIRAKQSAAQYAADNGVVCGTNSVAFTYDADGDKRSETHRYGNVAGKTRFWYDGGDRLVQVQQPHDSSDYTGDYWQTRYIYDLSGNGPLTIGTISGVYAHGNLAVTKEYNSGTWAQIKGDAYDALNRPVANYRLVPSEAPPDQMVAQKTYTYDGIGALGLLTSVKDALGQTATYTYDAAGRTATTTFGNDSGVTPDKTFSYDANGRAATIALSTGDSDVFAYDFDGLMKTRQEQTTGTISSPATLTYSYYPSGEKEGISVASTALTQMNLLQYKYRKDGLRTNLAFATAAVNASMTWNRSAAGRVTEVDDSSGQPNRTITYDAYGRETSDTMPSGTVSSMAYDVENELLTQKVPTPTTQTNSYNARGQLVGQVYSNHPNTYCTSWPLDPLPMYSPMKSSTVNGATMQEHYKCSGTAGWQGTPFDDLTGTAFLQASDDIQHVTTTFDNDGRESEEDDSFTDSRGCDNGPCPPYSGKRIRKYDAENHLLSDIETDWATAGEDDTGCTYTVITPQDPAKNHDDAFAHSYYYSYGPSGHPIKMTGNSVHWDGGSPLFVTDSGGSLLEVRVEGLLYYAKGTTNPVQFVDRDQSAYAVAAHWSGGHSAWSPGNPNHLVCRGRTDPSGYVLFQPGADGVSDGTNVFQGVRSYDPQLGQWNTPDAYAGEVADPMTQKAYMWNRGNSYMYKDPSGYDTIVLYDNKFAGVGHAAIFVTDDGVHGMYLCECGSTNGGAHGPSKLIGGMTTLSNLERGGSSPNERYDTGVDYHTTDAQQAKLISDFLEDAKSSNYDVLGHNCLEVCETALNQQGVDPGTSGLLGTMIPNVAAEQTKAVPLSQVASQIAAEKARPK